MITHIFENIEKAFTSIITQFSFASQLLEQRLFQWILLVRPQTVAFLTECIRPGFFGLNSLLVEEKENKQITKNSFF
jgi:hypothetical protein